MNLPELPAAAIAETVSRQLQDHPSLVVTAPPGAGKSTLLPLILLQRLSAGKRILMLEPRRLAARQIAERMAELLAEPVGQTIGYRMRFEHRISAQTRIEVITEGILTRMLVDDPTLDGVEMVIFDEFHERSLASDVGLALTREAQQVIRPDLRIVLMSATIDTDQLCQQLSAPLVRCEGRMFDVDIRYEIPEADVLNVAERVASVVRRAHQEHDGDILAFLPGEAEIRRCLDLLGISLGNTRILPLFGMLSSAEQRRAIVPGGEGVRKVVLATPIAETSLTIQGIRVVVDSGLYRTLVYDSQQGLSHLETLRISQDMATQRSGRAGRVSAGITYRLWSLATQHRIPETRIPEILRADLAPMVLDLAAWGETHPERLSWITPPPASQIAASKRLLILLGALDTEGKITAHGRRLAQLPCHPRIAQMLVRAETSVYQALATDIAALLEDRDPLPAQQAGADLTRRIEALRSARSQKLINRQWEHIVRVAEQYRHLIHLSEDNSQPDPIQVGWLLAVAYPERVAHAQKEGSGLYYLAGGEQAQVERDDFISSYDWLAVASLHVRPGGVGRILLAAPIEVSQLHALAWQRDQVSWDSRMGTLVAQHEWRVGQLLVHSKPLRIEPGNTLLGQRITEVICQAVKREGQSMLDFGDDVLHLQRRVRTVAGWHPEFELPDLSTEAVLQTAPEWLPYHLGKATTTADLKKLDLSVILWTLLSYEQQCAVERLAPSHITMPTGRRVKVEYRQGAELPILRVRIQDCFGMTDTPRVDEGRQPVLMELLSPGFKPVQLTLDLRSFWQNTYFEVRKELRRRYPKHAWPDNPL